MTRVNNLGHASRSRGPGPKKSNNNTSQPNNNSIGVIRGRVNQLIDQLTDNTNKGLNEDPTAKTLSFGEEDKSIANLTYTSMADGEEDGGRNKPGRPPRDPISKDPDKRFTTLAMGEEDGGRNKPGIPPRDPIAKDPDKRFTTLAMGEEDGGRNKPGRPPRDPISKRPQDQLTTFRDGEEGDNRFIYSQYTRLNIYQPQSFTS